MVVIGIIIGLLGHQLIIHGVKQIANTSTGMKIQSYIVNSTMGILYNKISTFIKTNLNEVKYQDNKKIYNYIFNLDEDNIIRPNNYNKITFPIMFNFYSIFINNITNLLLDNKKKISMNKSILKLNNINNFDDDNTNNFLKYLIKSSFSNFKILLYTDPQNFIYIEIIMNNESVVRKFTYNQLKDNFYKITLCLLENNKTDMFDDIHYNNIISFYYSYFNNGLSNNFILLKEMNELKTYHLIESEDMSITENYNPYRENGVIIAIKKFTSATYTKIVKYYKENTYDYSKKISEKIMSQIKTDQSVRIMSFMSTIFNTKSGGGVNENGNIELTSIKNNRIDFLQYILYNFDYENNFNDKFEDCVKNSNDNKLYAVIITYDIIKNDLDTETIPSLRINFLNQINKNIEDIDNELYKEKELLNNVSSKNINNNDILNRNSYNNNNNTQNVNLILFNNIRNSINQSFINEIITNFDLTNLLDEINFNIEMFSIISDKRKKYSLLTNENKIKESINIKNDFLQRNKDYTYNISINLNNFIYKYKLNINYDIKDLSQKKMEKDIKNYCEKCIKNLNTNFRLYLLKNNDLNTFFTNLINEDCNIDLIINNDNIYIIINKNEKVVILDCFYVYSLLSLSKNFDEIYYKISNTEFVYHIRNIDLFQNKSTYTFDKLFKQYNNCYCSISDSMKNLEIDELFINFENGLVNLISTKPTFINKIKKIVSTPDSYVQPYEIVMMENIFYNFNKYNRNFYNFFIKQTNVITKLIYQNDLLYIKIIDNKNESLIELNLFKSLFINRNFTLSDLYKTLNDLSEDPQKINCNISKFKNKKYSFYTIDDIKSIQYNIFDFDEDMIIVDSINNFNKNNNIANNNIANNINSTNTNMIYTTMTNGTSVTNTNMTNNGMNNNVTNNNGVNNNGMNMTNNNIINTIYTEIDNIYNKCVNLRIENDKIKIYNPQTGLENTELSDKFTYLDRLNLYLVNLYKSDINKNINSYRLKIECKKLYLEIIYKSKATFGGKNPSLLIDFKKIMAKLMVNKNYNNLTRNKNYFTTLKSYVKTNMSKNNLGKRKNNYRINNKCIS